MLNMMSASVLVAIVAALGASTSRVAAAAAKDFHYPAEEATERALGLTMLPVVSGTKERVKQRHAGDPVTPLPAVELQCPSDSGDGSTSKSSIPIGGKIVCGDVVWTLNAAWSGSGPNANANADVTIAVVEHGFAEWGMLAFIAAGHPPDVLRLPVGTLSGIDQPWYNISQDTLKEFAASSIDLPTARAAALTVDGEPDYPTIAAQLAPQRDTAAISHAADVVKFAVSFAGRVKCASTGVLTKDSTTGGIVELQDLHARPPVPQKVIFDPAEYVGYWPRTFSNMKTGLVGRHLGVAQVGAYTPGSGGFEVRAFGPVPPNEPGGVPPPAGPPSPPPPPPTPWMCHHWNSTDEAWIKQCDESGKPDTDCQKARCILDPTRRWSHGDNANFPGCGTCFCCAPYTASDDLPRLPNINYAPGAFVMLREEAPAGGALNVSNSTRYFYASNSTTFELGYRLVGAVEFYSAMLAVHRKYTALLAPAMQIELPVSDMRQADMVNAAMLATLNNYVGNQPNYGFGATYWSYGREDNGSLPLDMLSVDEALIGWGVCDTALDHLEFYFANYIGPHGNVVYFEEPWTTEGDAIADLGRLIDIYITAIDLCAPEPAWQTRLLPAVLRIGNLLLTLQRGVPGTVNPTTPLVECEFGPMQSDASILGSPVNGDTTKTTATTLADAQALCRGFLDCGGITEANGVYSVRAGSWVMATPSDTSWLVTNPGACHRGTPGAAGLIVGAPEHDWSSDTHDAFYNNNVWTVAGLERLGTFLVAVDPATRQPRNASLGADMTEAAAVLRVAVLASLAACAVDDPALNITFVPPFAHLNATPYTVMYASRESSYANFRFFSEPMLAGAIVPAEVQRGWLLLHNEAGGRLGGASRWESHLDDMPSAGWGYGALANNQTADFLAFLYGHMATYQSRGTFHSTEQLSFYGSGRYRGFNKLVDPAPSLDADGGMSKPPGHESVPAHALNRSRSQLGPVTAGYNGAETDISFCIVSNIIVARLTKWQLVMETAPSDVTSGTPLTVWLGRGAPQRWFRVDAGTHTKGPGAVVLGLGFNVSNAPTSVGRVNYNVVVTAPITLGHQRTSSQQRARYIVATTGSAAALATQWSVRWPGPLSGQADCSGCRVIASDQRRGFVTVVSTQPEFEVAAEWTAAADPE